MIGTRAVKSAVVPSLRGASAVEPRLRLLCDSNPMCYGSSTAMLAVLDELPDAVRTAVARDVSCEVLTRDHSVDTVTEVDVKDPAAVARAVDRGEHDAALVVSNQSNVELYRSWGLPVFYVDILYWFGAHKDQPVWALAERAFAQSFPGVKARLEAGASPVAPAMIGPLIRAIPPSERRRGTLATIGGARSRWIRPGQNSDYPAAVVRWLTAAREVLPAPATLACGRDAAAVANTASGAGPGDDWHAEALPQRHFLKRLGECEVYCTAPGQNAVFEGLAAGCPMLMLPPQNATQVAQLAVFEAAGIIAPGLNLPALDSCFPKAFEELTETRLTEAVLGSLGRIGARSSVTERVVAHLGQQLVEWPRRRAAREHFVAELGPPGAAAVATEINQWWRAQPEAR